MSSVISQLQCNGNNPIQLIGPLFGSTMQTVGLRYFPQAPGISINPSNVITGSASAAASKNGYLYVPGNGKANGQRLSLRANGDFTIGSNSPAASPGVTIGLYPVLFSFNAGNGPGNVPTIFSTPILSQTLTSAGGYQPWAFSAELFGTTNSGLVTLLPGSNISIDAVAGTVSTPALISGLSNINFSNPIPFGFVIGVTFSVALSGNEQAGGTDRIANLFEFDLRM